jgi:hypothetical protein
VARLYLPALEITQLVIKAPAKPKKGKPPKPLTLEQAKSKAKSSEDRIRRRAKKARLPSEQLEARLKQSTQH